MSGLLPRAMLAVAAAAVLLLFATPGGAQEEPRFGPTIPGQPLPPAPVDEPPPATEKPAPARIAPEGIILVPPFNDEGKPPWYVSTPAFVDQDTSGATHAGETLPCGSIGSTVWYRWKAPAGGFYVATTSGSSFDTVLARYAAADATTPLDCNDDDFGGLHSTIRFEAEAGDSFLFQAGGFSALQGSLHLAIAPIVGARDLVGDVYGGGPVEHDLTRIEAVTHNATGAADYIIFRVDFAGPILPPSSGDPYAIGGFIDLDTDANPATGGGAYRNAFGGPNPPIPLGIEYYVDIFAEAGTPGFFALFTSNGAFVQPLPMTFRPDGFTFLLPLSAVGSPSHVNYAAVIRYIATPTDSAPNMFDPARTACHAPWYMSPTVVGCWKADGLWHTEGLAEPAGMYAQTLAFNFNCSAGGLAGCTYDTGGAVSGLALSLPIGPLAEGASTSFKTLRDTEPYFLCTGGPDVTLALTSFDNGTGVDGLTGMLISPGGQTIESPQICNGSLTAQTIIAPLPARAMNLAFSFDSIDELFNNYVGQFLDDLIVCPEEISCDTDGDFCPDAREQGSNEIFGGLRNWYDVWDFYDVNGNGNIDVSDPIAILGAFGAGPGGPGYNALLDRYIPNFQEPWKTAKATGTHIGIDIEDVVANLQSFGHNCTGP